MKSIKRLIKDLITRILWSSMCEILEVKITEKFEHCVVIMINDDIVAIRGMLVVPSVGDLIDLQNGRQVSVTKRRIASYLGHEVRLYCEYI